VVHGVGQLSLISGWLPVVILVLGVLALGWLLLRRDRRQLRTVSVVLVLAVVLTLLLRYVVEDVWRPFPDALPISIYTSIGVGLLGLLLAGPRLRHGRTWRGRGLTVLAVVVVVLAATSQVNHFFRAYPTVSAALGTAQNGEVALDSVPGPQPDAVTGTPLSAVWTAPADMPSAGVVTQASIPATASGFTARPARIYLPPAYLASPRPVLPVLVLLAGQPGAPDDWLTFGGIKPMMDGYAAAHDGVAPVVVMADATGTELANPLCLDSELGQVETYLAVDVPAWVKATLQVRQDATGWAIAGSSYGGTCSLQMALNHPDVYPTFVDISGQATPTLGDAQRTLDATFGGDAARFAAVNPLDLMRRNQYPQLAGTFTVGANDGVYRPQQKAVAAAAQAAGMAVTYTEVPGGHDWGAWRAGLESSLGLLGTRLGITP
jgi:S-formylglutathione hydrolase FrmB